MADTLGWIHIKRKLITRKDGPNLIEAVQNKFLNFCPLLSVVDQQERASLDAKLYIKDSKIYS